MRFLIRLVITAAALWAATRLITGISYEGGWLGLLGVALVFGVLNAIVRPVLKFFTFPLFLITLGLFTFVLNAFMLWLASPVAAAFGLRFHVRGFAAAFWGALVVGIVSFLLSLLVPDRETE
ncbi:MAG TPA: phage holin family protein [Gemmatimonadaceae bacterium]|nr:phage holin family protein [Gemmatimonadaceae bacterium]